MAARLLSSGCGDRWAVDCTGQCDSDSVRLRSNGYAACVCADCGHRGADFVFGPDLRVRPAAHSEAAPGDAAANFPAGVWLRRVGSYRRSARGRRDLHDHPDFWAYPPGRLELRSGLGVLRRGVCPLWVRWVPRWRAKMIIPTGCLGKALGLGCGRSGGDCASIALRCYW